MFDFDEKNNCVSITKWGYEENMPYTYSMLWDSLITFDVYNNIIDIGQDQRIEVIQSNKERLDSIMKHFPEFQYSMNWK